MHQKKRKDRPADLNWELAGSLTPQLERAPRSHLGTTADITGLSPLFSGSEERPAQKKDPVLPTDPHP